MRTVAHISDIHFGKIDLRIADALASKLHELNPSLTIISGDLTQRARAWQFQAAADYLKRLPQPQLVVPGNHDVPLYDVARRFFAPTQLYRRYICADADLRDRRPEDFRMFYDDEFVVLGLNSARAFTPRWKGFWKDGHLSGEQIKNAGLFFRDADTRWDVPQKPYQPKPVIVPRPRKVRILVTHHPIIPAPNSDPEDFMRLEPWELKVLESSGADLLLAGHLHRGYGGDVKAIYKSVSRSMLSIQAGTATSTRLRGMPNSFNLFHIASDRIELLVHHWNGVTFQADERQLFLRDAAGWHAEQH